jgi:hypothetical protein
MKKMRSGQLLQQPSLQRWLQGDRVRGHAQLAAGPCLLRRFRVPLSGKCLRRSPFRTTFAEVHA